MRTLENALRRRLLPRGRGRRGRARAAWLDRSSRRRSCSIPTVTLPGVCDSKLVPARRARAPVRAHRAATRWPGRWRPPTRARSTTSISIRPRCERCSARSWRSSRCRTSCSWTRFACRISRWRSAASRTETAGARRSRAASIVAKVTRDREHARTARPGSALRLRPAQSATPRPTIWRLWLDLGYSDAHRRSFRPPTLFDTID